MANNSGGSITLWRFTENQRNYPGWNLSADERGIATLLDALAWLRTKGGHRTVEISPPTGDLLRAANNQGGSESLDVPAKWRIELAPRPEMARRWSFPANLHPACLTLGEEMLTSLEESLKGIGRGEGDRSIGANQTGERLWFWWRP